MGTVRYGLMLYLIASGGSALAQSDPNAINQHPQTDAAKVVDALRGGPASITANATILDWPSKPGEPFRTLRAGNDRWFCLSAIPSKPHDEPGCYDPVYLEWLKAQVAGRPSKLERIGVSYMYGGAWVDDVSHVGPPTPDHTFHVGPHIMIVTPHDADLQGINTDGSSGGIYVVHMPGKTESYLVIPVDK